MNHCNGEARVARGGTLVLGGGIAGSYVARRLGPRGATILNPTNFMLYTPLLPEAAAGGIEPRHVTVPLRAMCPHADQLLGSAVALDPERRTVDVESDAERFALEYSDLAARSGCATACCATSSSPTPRPRARVAGSRSCSPVRGLARPLFNRVGRPAAA